MNRWIRYLAPAVLLIPLLLPISDELRFHVLWGVMGKRLHIAIFAMLTVWLRMCSPVRMNWIAAGLVAMSTGAAIELLQSVSGRTASVTDLGYNAMGVGFGFAFIAWRSRRRVIAVLLASSLVLLVLYQMRDLPREHAAVTYARSLFPIIADFESGILDHTWKPFFDAEMEYASSEDSAGEGVRVLRMRFPAGDSYPGVATGCFPLDWSGHRHLCADMRIAAGRADTLAMGVRLEDSRFLKDGDYHSGSFAVVRQWRSVRIPLEGAGTRDRQRPLNLTRMITLKFFVRQPEREGVVEIDNVRLE